ILAMKILCASVLLVAACGSSNKTTGDGPGSGSADAKVYMDAPASIPAMITISGTASSRDLSGNATPVQGVAVAAYKKTDPTTAVATATTDASGNYSLTVTTGGAPVDGYLKATKSGNTDTYLYPPAPLIADFTMGSINMLTPTTYQGIYVISQVT